MTIRAGRELRRMPAGYRRIKGKIYRQYDRLDVELEAAKELAGRLRAEADEAGRPRYLDVKVVNKMPGRGLDGCMRRYGRVFVARPEDNGLANGSPA